MAKEKKSILEKTLKYTYMYSKEFKIGPKHELFCSLCNKTVDSSRKSSIESHRKSSKHQSFISRNQELSSQTFLTDLLNDWNKNVVKTFLAADIPLFKLNNIKFKDLFRSIGFNLPSETSASKIVNDIHFEELIKLEQYFNCSDIFLIFDESIIN